jgi:chaperonin GroES
MIEAIGDRLIVQIAKEEKEKKVGTLIVPVSTEKKTCEIGHVLSVGPDVKGILPRDTVFINKFGGATMSHEGVDFISIRQTDILGVIREKANV